MTRSNALRSLSLAALASATLLAAPLVRADEGTPGYPTVSTSTLTRAAVQADLAQARRDGSIKVWSSSYNPLADFKGSADRAQVRAAAQSPLANGVSAQDLVGEDSGSFALSRARALPAPMTLAGAR